jgi:ABC-type multidrug transport system permease subunit
LLVIGHQTQTEVEIPAWLAYILGAFITFLVSLFLTFGIYLHVVTVYHIYRILYTYKWMWKVLVLMIFAMLYRPTTSSMT